MIPMEYFNMVKGFPIDYMHCVLLGVVKQITGLLLTAKKGDKHYISKKGI